METEEESKNFFKVIQTTKLDDLVDKSIKELPESDLCIQTDTHIVQYKFVEGEEKRDKYEIKPGIWTIIKTNDGLQLKKLELKTHNLLESATNTQIIKHEANVFFSKLDIYKKFKKEPKRSILLYSQPGMGKSSNISKISQEFIGEDEGTVVVFWDTSDISSSSVSKFFSTGSYFNDKCTRMLFVMEDIGGGNVEGHYGPKAADASLLEFLDGASVSFRKPTFIIATTNTPENLLKSLADRPGRFDQMFELKGPKAEERVKLAKHIAGRDLEKEEELALKSKDADGLSIAHVSEIIVRSALHDKSFADVILEMKNHKAMIEKRFQEIQQKKMGL